MKSSFISSSNTEICNRYDKQQSTEVMMDINNFLSLAKDLVQEIYSLNPNTRNATLRELKKKINHNELNNIFVRAVVDGCEHLKRDAEHQKFRSKRFETIPKFFPSPNTKDDLDMLIYSRMIMGYTNGKTGHSGKRLKQTFKKYQTSSKYVEFLLNHQDINQLGQDNFHYLCEAGCPQATHEWMFVYDFPTNLLKSTSTVTESKKLLAAHGY